MSARPHASILAALALASGCCFAGSESHVSAPATLDEVRALGEQPGVVVEIREHVRYASGGGSCGHSIFCIVLIPIALANVVIPAAWYDEATITRDGTLVYRGAFDPLGRFISAQSLEDGEWRELAVLPLDRLGERPIVITRARAALDGGEMGDPRAVPILPQVDLATAYREALARAWTSIERARLVEEALLWLGEEIVPTIVGRLSHEADASELDATLRYVCTPAGAPGATEVGSTYCVRLVAAALQQTMDLDRALAVTPWLEAGEVSLDAQGPLALAVVDGVCGGGGALRAGAESRGLDALAAYRGSAIEPALAVRISACPAAEPRMSLRLASGIGAVDAVELATLLRTELAPGRMLRHLDFDAPDQRRAIFAALDRSDSGRIELLGALAGSTLVPDASELEALVRAHASITSPLEEHRFLSIVAHARGSSVDASSALLAAHTQSVAAADRGRHAALRMVLGDASAAPEVARAIDPERVDLAELDAILSMPSMDTVLAAALVTCGCSPLLAVDFARAVRAGREVASCTH